MTMPRRQRIAQAVIPTLVVPRKTISKRRNHGSTESHVALAPEEHNRHETDLELIVASHEMCSYRKIM